MSVLAIYIKVLLFHQMIAPSKAMKNVFLKAVGSWDIPTHTFQIQKEKWMKVE